MCVRRQRVEANLWLPFIMPELRSWTTCSWSMSEAFGFPLAAPFPSTPSLLPPAESRTEALIRGGGKSVFAIHSNCWRDRYSSRVRIEWS